MRFAIIAAVFTFSVTSGPFSYFYFTGDFLTFRLQESSQHRCPSESNILAQLTLLKKLRTKKGSARPPQMACRIFSSTFSDPSDYGAAQAQIEKMKTALQTPNSGKVKPLLKEAFGEQGKNYQLPEVIKTVNTLDKGIIQASIPTKSFPDKDTIAAVD